MVNRRLYTQLGWQYDEYRVFDLHGDIHNLHPLDLVGHLAQQSIHFAPSQHPLADA